MLGRSHAPGIPLLLTTLLGLLGCGAGAPGEGAGGGGDGGLIVIDVTPDLQDSGVELRHASSAEQRRPAAILEPPAARTTELTIPSGRPTLRFAYGVPGPMEGACFVEVRFRAVIHPRDGEPFVGFEGHLPGNNWGWRSADVPLETWAGERVALSLEATPVEEGAERAHCSIPSAAFADVRVVAGKDPGDTRPDLWIVVIDALRADHVGYLGQDPPDTPNLDALATASYRFTDAISTSSWTLEAVFALLTGSHATAARRGTRNMEQLALADHVPTVAGGLGKAGYRAVGVYANAVLAPGCGLERDFDTYAHVAGDADLPGVVETLLGESDPRRPQLVYTHLISPHSPYCTHEGITERYLREAEVPEPWPTCAGEIGDNRGRGVEPDAQARVAAYYRGEVEFADLVLGQLIALADARETERPLWLIVTADHGEELWDHGDFEHGHTLYRELLHVPLLIRPPGDHAVRTGGETVDAPVSLVDLGDTLLELGGVPLLDTTSGVSLEPLLEGGASPLPAHRTRLAYGLIYGPPRVALIQPDRKRILTWGRPPSLEIFDRTDDPTERNPLGEADDAGERASFAADWRLYQRLATTGTACLRIDAGGSTTDGLEVSVETAGEVVPLTGERLTSPPLANAGSGAHRFPVDPRGEPLTLQLSGLGEATPPLRVSLTRQGQTVDPSSVDWPAGSTVEGSSALVPTPWATPPTGSRTTSPPDGVTVSWLTPASAAPVISAPEDRQQQRLRALGYVE